MLPKLPLLLLLLTLLAAPAHAQEAAPPDKPILRIETGMHTAPVTSISVDAANRCLVTASDDKTVRVWDAKTGALLNILRPPIGDGSEGRIYAAAISPDSLTVACGGFTDPYGQSQSIFLFDRATGRLRQRLSGLPNAVNTLTFSPDGRFLVAALGSGGGIRLYRTSDYSLVAQDKDYDERCFGASFGSVGGALRLVISCLDGFLRLYDVDRASGALHLRAKRQALVGGQPIGVAFSPGEDKIAVGFYQSLEVAVLSGDDLSILYVPNADHGDFGDFSKVCWSADGRFLYAGGRYGFADKGKGVVQEVVRKWAEGGQGTHMDCAAAVSVIADLQPRREGGAFYGSADPSWGMLDAQDQAITLSSTTVADLRGNWDGFCLNADGSAVAFGYQSFGRSPAIFSLADHQLTPGGDSAGFSAPITTADGLDVRGWKGTTKPILNDQLLEVGTLETSRSLAIAPDHVTFLLGTDWSLHLFRRNGTEKWQVTAPSAAWAVNISGDGKLAVAAFGDGTIRWYRMTDGQELLDFFPHADQKRWVLWTPSGYYDCSPGAEDLIGWHVNHGRDQAADFFPVSRFRDTYYRPDVVSKILTTQDEAEALKQADAEAGRKAQTADIQTRLPPVVAITAPEDGASVSTDHLALRYILRTPSGEPVTEVRALVDGRPAQTESGLSVVSSAGITRALSVPVPPRDCLVSVLAFNKFGASEPASLHVHWAGTGNGTDKGTEAVPSRGYVRADFVVQPKLYLLAVGISKYQDTSLTLNYSAKDAGDFVQAMRAQKGKLYRDVAVYQDKALTDAEATRDNILDGLDWLQKQATSNDVAMIFLSGHGSNDANGKYFFLPANFDRDKIKRTGLPWTDIVSTVQDIAGKVILFNDSCHSGNVLGGGLKGLPDNTGAINELISAENGAVVFAASTGSEYAREDPAWNNGAFTKALVEGVGGSADYGHTGRITVNMLSLYVAERVKTLTGGSQHPTANKPPTVRDFPVALDEGK